MHTVFVKYNLPQPVSRTRVLDEFKAVENRFRSTPKLLRKYFCYDEPSHTGYSFYLWESEADAKAFYDQAFIDGFKEKFNTTPELTFVDVPLIVDNIADRTILEKY